MVSNPAVAHGLGDPQGTVVDPETTRTPTQELRSEPRSPSSVDIAEFLAGTGPSRTTQASSVD